MWNIFKPTSNLQLAVDRFDKYGSDELSKVRLHEALTSFIERNLGWDSVVSPEPLLWVGIGHSEVHKVFALDKMKGGVAWPSYGLSFDFVPKAVRKSIRLAPAPAGAKFDIIIDGRDHLCEITFSFGPECALQDAKRYLPRTFKQAKSFWQQFGSVEKIGDALAHMDAHFRAIDGPGRVQAEIARPFLLKAVGQTAEAQKCLANLSDLLDDKAIAKLATLLQLD